MNSSIVVLAGGVGAARFLDGLAAAIPPEQITVILNTGDDAEFHGLRVCPDLDTVLYTLAGIVDPERGWGVAGDTYHCLDILASLRKETWFRLGDRDLATHVVRTERTRQGAPLSKITDELRRAYGVASRIFPMTDDTARTRLRTSAGWLSFQEYFVKLRHEPEVLEADFSEAAASTPAPSVLEAIAACDGVIVGPSNPVLSIGPILAVPGIREALSDASAPVVAVTPIVGGKALKGPTDRNLASLGMEASAAGVAELYKDFLDIFILDEQDTGLRRRVEHAKLAVAVTQTVMSSQAARRSLAEATLSALGRTLAR
jgi:LPPG:FO 2-phospho-L-lactate transferase